MSRWFGGVLLGASGLVRAYGKAASLGVVDAGIQIVKTCRLTTVAMEYALLGKLEHYLSQEAYLAGDTTYGEDVRMQIYLEPERQARFMQDVANLTAARAQVDVGAVIHAAFSEKGDFLQLV